MKPFIPFLLLLCFSLGAIAQNNLFLPFGQSKEQIKRYLSTRDYIQQIVDDASMHTVRAVLDPNKQVEYVFQSNMLYATTVSRHYNDKRIAREVQKNVLDYMDYMSRGALRQTNQDRITVYTAVTESRVIKLFVQNFTNSSTLMLTSVSRQHVPEGHTDEYYEVELLSQMSETFISN